MADHLCGEKRRASPLDQCVIFHSCERPNGHAGPHRCPCSPVDALWWGGSPPPEVAVVPDPPSAHWSASPANPPLSGAEHHWLLTPCCDTTGVTGMTGLPADVREAFWDALDELTRDVPGYSYAVHPGEVVVHVVAGGNATFEFKPAPKETVDA